MKKIFNLVAKFVEVVCKIMLFVQVISVMVVVIGRYFFNHTPAWGEELTLMMLVWVSLAGAMIPLRGNTHLRMTVFDSKLSPRVLLISDLFCEALIFIFSVVLLVAGIIQTAQTWKTILHGIKISRGYLYAAVPVSMALYLWTILELNWDRFVVNIKKRGDK